MNVRIPTIETLTNALRASKDKEAFRQLDKTRGCRIGIGVRQEATGEPRFYVEVLLSLSGNTDAVNLPRLENVIRVLQSLQARGYSLSYLDGTTHISCEITLPYKNLLSEYSFLKSLAEP